MAIAKNPKRKQSAVSEDEVEAFISGAAPQTSATPQTDTGSQAKAQENEERSPKKEPIMVRVDPAILKRIDHAAKRLGISRSAFIVSSAAERLERME